MTELQNKVLTYLTKLSEKPTGYRVGPRSTARDLNESEEAIEQTLSELVDMGKVRIFVDFGQDYWGVK